MENPEDYPTCLIGYVHGPVRWETRGGNEFWFGKSKFFLNQEPICPNESGGGLWALTHLQKKSRFGFLLMKPFCFHIWFTWKFQEQDEKGGWKPGTEVMRPYARTPGQRWDAGDGKFIRTGGYFGGHWD